MIMSWVFLSLFFDNNLISQTVLYWPNLCACFAPVQLKPEDLVQSGSVRRAMGVTVEPVLESPPPSLAPSIAPPSETTDGSVVPDASNALPDDIAKELDDVETTGDDDGKADDDDVDADVGDELLELFGDKAEGAEVIE